MPWIHNVVLDMGNIATSYTLGPEDSVVMEHCVLKEGCRNGGRKKDKSKFLIYFSLLY